MESFTILQHLAAFSYTFLVNQDHGWRYLKAAENCKPFLLVWTHLIQFIYSPGKAKASVSPLVTSYKAHASPRQDCKPPPKASADEQLHIHADNMSSSKLPLVSDWLV